MNVKAVQMSDLLKECDDIYTTHTSKKNWFLVPLSLYFISQGFWLKLKERNNQDEFIFLSKMHFKS